RSRARTTAGRRTGATPLAAAGAGIHLLETVRAAAPFQAVRGRAGGRLLLRAEDLRRAVREGREANLVLFVVDTSGSMAARERMRQVKTAILSLLLDAYRRRDRVAVVTFRGDGADVALPATRSVDVAARRLDDLPAGGRTPLAEGLIEAVELVRRERLRDPGRRPLLVVITDGRATSGADAVARSRRAADYVASQRISSVVVDCESGRMRMGLARTLAEHMGADHVWLAQVNAEALTDIVRGATREGAA
ncbi:vWA domain-containing protein, partial [Mycolicibacterium madagascariense]